MQKTQLTLTSVNKAKINHHTLSKLLERWEKLAELVEEKLQPEEGATIHWILKYNWAPDDDPECSRTPQYQPLIFGSVVLLSNETEFPIGIFQGTIEFNHVGIEVYRRDYGSNPNVELLAENISESLSLTV